MKITDAAEALLNLERMVAVVKGHEGQESKFAKALATLKALSRRVADAMPAPAVPPDKVRCYHEIL